jgi:hypothetical protein
MRLAVAASSRDQICSRFVDGLLNHVRGNKIKFCPRDTIPHIDYAAVVAFWILAFGFRLKPGVDSMSAYGVASD